MISKVKPKLNERVQDEIMKEMSRNEAPILALGCDRSKRLGINYNGRIPDVDSL